MSLVYDKGKYNKYFADIEQTKSKNNYNSSSMKVAQKKNQNKNTHLYRDFIGASPIKNITNNKKTNFLTTYQNNNNYNDQQNNKKKNLKSTQLKYNKSFEGNMINDNFDFVNDDIYTIPHGNNRANHKFNNKSMILDNNKQLRTKNKNNKNNKSITRTINSHNNMNSKKNNLDENIIIKKLDEKFKSLENNIIDKKYENDIDHDEMIISTNKRNLNNNKNATRLKNQNSKNMNSTNTNYKLSNIINENNDFNLDNKKEDILMSIFDNKNNIEFDENYLFNTSFESNRNDFNIMYTDDYEKTVVNDMLSLEIKLLIEKMLELQKSYHKELNIIVNQYNKNEKVFNLLVEKIKMLQKKLCQIQKFNKTKNIKGNIYNFIGIYNNNNKHDINKINFNEFFLWKYIMNISNKGNSKDNLKDLFRKIVFEKYYKLSGKLDKIENQIILNLMKKFKYNINSNKKNNVYNNNLNNANIIGNLSSNSDKNKIVSTSPLQINKTMVKPNKNINNSSINNKKRHKKTSSCCQSKPTKFTYFRNNKQK